MGRAGGGSATPIFSGFTEAEVQAIAADVVAELTPDIAESVAAPAAVQAQFNAEATALVLTDEVRDNITFVVVSGSLSAAAGAIRYRFPVAIQLTGVSAAVSTAPTGQSLIADVHKNGTTVFTTQANRPTILASATATASETVPDVTAVAAGDYLTIDVDQVGSGTAGSNLTVAIRWQAA